MTREAMLAKTPVPRENIHPIPTDGAPEHAARRYERMLQEAYGAMTLDPQRPLFDVTLTTASWWTGLERTHLSRSKLSPSDSRRPKSRSKCSAPALAHARHRASPL